MEVRSYSPEDAAPLAEVYHRAVREGAVRAYAPEQVAAWSPQVPEAARWRARLEAADTVVATEAEDPVGFMTMDDNGYLDLAFVLPDVMGKGVSDAIYAVLEGRARSRGIRCLSTQASLLAEPFFARHGWQVVRRQEVEMDGVVLANAWMEKRL
ncbi:MAG: GNAT family N-acetyltransferase [Silicimonas sp.]|jgi:putative acetyltransferase|nr:GNAT family N-acetyltransferase [Silicimonas sp.]